MRFYNRPHRHYCGIDLHVKTMYLCILDATGQVLLHRVVATTPEAFLTAVAPYREDLVVAVECMVTWYWLADFCAAQGITFVLGHALAMKAIRGGKAKNDKIDAHKIAVLLRGGLLPQSYMYPAAMRATRDLLRRRLHLVRKRGRLLAHIQNTRAQHNLPAFERRLVLATQMSLRDDRHACTPARRAPRPESGRQPPGTWYPARPHLGSRIPATRSGRAGVPPERGGEHHPWMGLIAPPRA